MKENFSSIYIIKKKDLLHGGKRLNSKLSRPLLSIITVVLNGEEHLEKTIKSVLKQKKIFEYILIDGKSKDSSLKIIKKYSNKISYWVSEKDDGLYDAFNKGMKLAQGQYIGIINSDDVYTANAFNIIHKYITKNPKVDFIFGSVKKHWGILHGYKPKKIKFSWGFYSSHSTGFYIKKDAAKKVGLYNIKYKYHADYDYFYRMIVKKKLKGIATKKNEVVGVFRRGGFSSTIPYRKMFIEDLKIRYDNGQNILFLLILGIYKILNYWKKKIIK
ncbi:glycosyltransferase [Candidatus Pelagibacter sp.]|nr:glycosyltransferase [Candidatus Pelagibacter sp.]